MNSGLFVCLSSTEEYHCAVAVKRTWLLRQLRTRRDVGGVVNFSNVRKKMFFQYFVTERLPVYICDVAQKLIPFKNAHANYSFYIVLD